MNEDDFDVDAVLAIFHDDVIWDSTTEFSIGETIRGKNNMADWFHRWKEEFPKRKFDVPNICFSSCPLNLFKNVVNIQWTLTETDKQGKTFRYNGVTIAHMKNFKCIHISDYMSCIGLPKLSDLIEPLAED